MNQSNIILKKIHGKLSFKRDMHPILLTFHLALAVSAFFGNQLKLSQHQISL